jgi:hypothetical protein
VVAALGPLQQQHFETGAGITHDDNGGGIAGHGYCHGAAPAELKRHVFMYMNKRYMYVYTAVKGRFPATGEAPALVQ